MAGNFNKKPSVTTHQTKDGLEVVTEEEFCKLLNSLEDPERFKDIFGINTRVDEGWFVEDVQRALKIYSSGGTTMPGYLWD